MIIDIEGTDGSGKHTQTMKLFEKLKDKGYRCLLVSFPNYESESSAPVKMFLRGDLGDKVSCLNCYQASVLFAVDRLITMKKLKLDEYDYVLFDRYTPSNMIHQSTRIQNENELDEFLEWLEDFEYGKLCLPKPDKCVFLDVPVDVSFKLAKKRGELKNGQANDIIEADKDELYHAYARAKYVAEKFDWDVIDCVDDELKSIEEIHSEILTKLNLNGIL